MKAHQIESVSKFLRKKTSFDWDISNYSEIFEKSEVLTYTESSKFQIVVHNQVTERQLQLYPKGIVEKIHKLMPLYLNC